jgi:hypothetical protein
MDGTQTRTYGPSQANRWQIISISFHIVTDATVASRVPAISITNGGIFITAFDGGVSLSASSTRNWTFAPLIPAVDAGATQNRTTPLPADQIQIGNDTIKLSIANGQAGDAITNIQLRLRMWQNPYNL